MRWWYISAQVLSVGIQNITLSRTSEPVVFRINSNQDVGFLPENDQYVTSPVAMACVHISCSVLLQLLVVEFSRGQWVWQYSGQ